jgi:Sigma-70 region 2
MVNCLEPVCLVSTCRQLVPLYERSVNLDVPLHRASMLERFSRCYSSGLRRGSKKCRNHKSDLPHPLVQVIGGDSMLVMPLETTRQVHEQEWGLLIAQTAQGDQTALATLYDRTSPHVYGLALNILDNREAAEEVTLDVYTQAWRQAHSYDETRGTPGSWPMPLARTRAIDRYRAGAAERGRIESLNTVELFASDRRRRSRIWRGKSVGGMCTRPWRYSRRSSGKRSRSPIFMD